MKQYTVTGKVLIPTSRENVWEVLTNPVFIKQWDDVPEAYQGGRLTEGSILEWEGHVKMTVTSLKEKEELQFHMFIPKLRLAPDQYRIFYTYRLSEQDGQTELSFEIGDFASLPDPQSYYKATLDFVASAREKIRALSLSL
jgi:uncharacterized protein YndB with AHSA1/START domain